MYSRVVLLISILLFSCGQPNQIDKSQIQLDIQALMVQQEVDWNTGNIEGYMSGYWQSDSLRFASGGNVYYGWQTTLARYKRKYPDKITMGLLKFTIYDINIIAADNAIVFGKWELTRESDKPTGLYTLALQLISSKWKIVADHTSSAQN